jgi:hypothetical protein
VSAASDAEKLSALWRLKLPRRTEIPKKPEQWLTPDILVTGDPAYMLGMSTYTTGWTSCMAQPRGQYRRGVIAWLYLPGTRVAAMLSKKTITHAGIERRVMVARALVHEMRDDAGSFYDRIYGHDDNGFFAATLEAAGIRPISECPRGATVRGHAPKQAKPYCDTLTHAAAKSKSGRPCWVFSKR